MPPTRLLWASGIGALSVIHIGCLGTDVRLEAVVLAFGLFLGGDWPCDSQAHVISMRWLATPGTMFVSGPMHRVFGCEFSAIVPPRRLQAGVTCGCATK
jgi:hypothetical protein